MNNQRIRIAAVIGFCLMLTACGAETALPDLSAMGTVTVISREEGSGTKSEFERMLGTDGTGTKEIAASTEEVLEKVAEDTNAIGYIAYSSLTDTSRVKTIAVDGVNLSAKNIRQEKYPLCRKYYLAYSGKLNDVEQDFVTYILSAGQDIVGDCCIAVKKSSTFLSDRSSGTIRINGSSSMAPLVTLLAEEYQSVNPNASISLETSDSTAGLTAAMRGECDLAMSSRELESYEEELLTKTAIGADAIAVIVQADNPVESLSQKQLKALYNGVYHKWSAIQ